MQIANVKQRQIWFPRVGKIWVSTPQNLASEEVRAGLLFIEMSTYFRALL